MEPGSEDPGYLQFRFRGAWRVCASMEPGSEDPGYLNPPDGWTTTMRGFNGAGVRRPRIPAEQERDQLKAAQASMEPGSEDPGYVGHRVSCAYHERASMEPGSEDPGYLAPYLFSARSPSRFNGAGVRRPRILGIEFQNGQWTVTLQWSRGPKTPDTGYFRGRIQHEQQGFNGAGVRRPRILHVAGRERFSPGLRFNGAGVRRPRILWRARPAWT